MQADNPLGHPRKLIRNIFIIAGLVNVLGILAVSHAFTNTTFFEVFPAVFSPFGVVAIILWGLAYIAVSASYAQVRWLCAVFFLEKMAYVASWVWWLQHNPDTIELLIGADLLTGLFFAAYGANDLLFGLFFAWVWYTLRSR